MGLYKVRGLVCAVEGLYVGSELYRGREASTRGGWLVYGHGASIGIWVPAWEGVWSLYRGSGLA